MKSVLVFAVLVTMSARVLGAQAAKPDNAAHHVFTIDTLKLESGAVLPGAKVVYGTYGRLNARRDNAILLPSHYLADHHGYDWLVGPGRLLDTSRVFLVMTELFGNGRSSSPSNTPEPLHGPRFPVPSIRDNIGAVHRLLVEDLKIEHLRAIIGFSMGAQQAFQWAVSYPRFADRIVATSGTAKTYPHGVVRLEGQIAALTADAEFKDGDYVSPPKKGLEAFAVVWTAWLFSQDWWRLGLWKNLGPSYEVVLDNLRKNFIPNADANDLILQMRTWERHDVGGTPGFDGDVEKALRSIKVPLLYMPSATDLYFPIGDATYESRFIPGVSFVPIPSLWGHPAGAGMAPADLAFLTRKMAAFLRPVLARP
ncbi:MAG: alpha/beta fold hydrolase [Gemmatimonadota bacterium]